MLSCVVEYDSGGVWNHSPLSTRKLLMHKEEIRKVFGKTQQKGLTLIALRLYLRGGRVKIELALARGKKDWDRRDQERNKEAEREAKQAIYNSRRR
jgi:SsrA-binding protein